MVDGATRRFLITGGCGFIGSHLAEALLAQGHHVDVIDDLSTGGMSNVAHLLGKGQGTGAKGQGEGGAKGRGAEGPGAFTVARASITDGVVLDRLASQADVIVHLAAAVGVQLVVDRPTHTIETNIMGAEAVLQAALRYGCRVLLASTSEVYGKGVRIPFAEDDDVLIGPTSKSRWSYAASKMVDEFLGLAYHREHGLEVVVLRLFNTVGPRQTGRYGMVLPRFVQQARAGEPITVYGDGQQSRCFCDVRDVVRAMIGLADHPAAIGRVFNVGSTEEVTILELAEQVRRVTGSASEIVMVPYDEAYSPGFEDMSRRVPDTTRIHELLGWAPQHSLADILAQFVA